MLIYNLLEEQAPEANLFASWQFWVIIGVLVLFLAYSFWTSKKRRKQMEEEQAKRNDIHPGYMVTTIGGIMGVVESVDSDANTFVLKTGTDECPTFIKFDKQAIYSSENPNPDIEAVEPLDEKEVFENPTEQEEQTEKTEETVETETPAKDEENIEENI